MEVSYRYKNSYLHIAVVGSFAIHLLIALSFLSVKADTFSETKQLQMIQMSILKPEPKKVEKKEPVVQKEVKKEIVIPPKPKINPQIKKKIIQKKIVQQKVTHLPKRVKQEQKLPPLKQEVVEQPKEVPQQAPVQIVQTPPRPSKIQETVAVNTDILSSYLAEVREQIQNNLYYPYRAKRLGLEGQTVVSFLITKDGEVDKKSLKIIHSSGNKILDQSALESILQAAPFGKVPQRALHINIPVVFRLRS